MGVDSPQADGGDLSVKPHTDRREFILNLVRQEGQVDVGEVAQVLNVSPMTVRRDLAHLDQAGLLRRVHGGATARPSPSTRSATMSEEKRRIAKAVDALVTDGDVVGIDVGTTCTAVAAQLALRDGLLGVTNSLQAALQFQYSTSSMVVLGGMLTNESSLINGGLLETRRSLNLDKLVLGCGGVSADRGISYFDLAETEIRAQLVAKSETVILVADHTKFDRVKPVTLDAVDILDILVTTAEPPAPLRTALDRASVDVIVV